jgi:prepilin-type N-terminal cleavage/methylation domain-containing protein
MTSAARTSNGRAGFSLLEIVIALSIATLMMGGAIAFLVFRTDERKLRSTASEIELLAKQARTTAILRQTPYAIEFRPGSVRMTPMAGAGLAQVGSMSLNTTLGNVPVQTPEAAPGGGGKSVEIDSALVMFVRRWNTADWQPMSDKFTHVWRFDPDGLCEPLGVRLETGGNHIEITFHPLTATVWDTALEVK